MDQEQSQQIKEEQIIGSSSTQEEALEKLQADFLKDLVLSKKKSEQQKSEQDGADRLLPYNLICKIAEMLDHYFVLNKLSLVSKHFYIAMQFRYRSLCITNKFISEQTASDPLQEVESISDQSMIQKTLEERLIDSKNFMSIYGKFMSKCQMTVDLKRLHLDPFNPDQIFDRDAHPKNKSAAAEDEVNAPESKTQPFTSTFRNTSIITSMHENLSHFFKILALSDGRHFICTHRITKAELLALSATEFEQQLLRDEKQMIPLPHANISSIATSQNQIVFTTKDESGEGSSKLYHGVLEWVNDPDEPAQQINEPEQLIPAGMQQPPQGGNQAKKILQLKNIFGPIQVAKSEEESDYSINIKLVAISQGNCVAVVRRVYADSAEVGDRQLEFLYTWTLDKLIVQSQENEQLVTNPISEEIAIVTQEKDSVVQWPTFKEIKATSQFALLSESHDVYIIGPHQQKKGQLECRMVNKLSSVVQLEANGHHCLAFKIIKQSPIAEWTSEQVASFLEQNGFEEHSKMAISHKITGQHIHEFDEDFWIETFGIRETFELQKLRFEVAQNQKGRIVKQEVFGWGNNTWGQLGFSCHETAHHPKSIPLPEEISTNLDEIIQIHCGNRHSVLLTKSGKVWVTGNIKDAKPQKQEEEKQGDKGQKNEAASKGNKQKGGKSSKKGNKLELEEDAEQFDDSHSQGKQKKGGKGQKKGKKWQQEEEAQQIVEAEAKTATVTHRWFNLLEKRGEKTIISHKFQIEKIKFVDQQHFLTLDVSRKFIPIGSKYFVAVGEFDVDAMGSIIDPSNKKNQWGKKFKDVDRVMAFLCYDRKIFNNSDGSQKQYTVVYEDRFVGNVETEVWRFHEEMDIPSHRVRMLKLNGQVIWDRQKKFSLI